MKKNLLVLLTTFVLGTLTAKAQYAPLVTPPTLQKQTISKFDDGKPITSQDINSDAGFWIAIPVKSNIQLIYLKNSSGFVAKLPKTASDATNNYFHFNKPYSENQSVAFITTDPTKDKNPAVITLSFTGDAANADVNTSGIHITANQFLPPLPTACQEAIKIVSTKGVAGEECKKLVAADKFGELVTNYDYKKIIYIFDFDPTTNLKLFWKIYRKKKDNNQDHDFLQMDLANFNNETIKPHTHFQIKIVNVNKFMYDVTLNHNFTNYDSQPSALFNQFFVGDSNQLGSLMSAYSSNLTAKLQDAGNTDSNTSNMMLDLMLRIRCFYERYNGFNAQMLQAYNPCSGFLCCQDFEYHDFTNQLLYIKLEMAQILGQANDAKAKLAAGIAKIAACKKNTSDIAAAQKVVDSVNAIKTPSPADTTKRGKAAAQVKTLTAKSCSAADLAKMVQDTVTQSAEVNQFSSINAIMSKLPSESDIRKLAIFLNNMVRANTVEVINEEVVKGNRFNLFIDIKAKDSLVKYVPILPYHDTIPISLPVIGKPFVSFSSGSFMALGSNLKNKTYNWQQVSTNKQVSDNGNYILTQSGYSSPVMGFTALGNVEWKTSTSLGFGASGGVGLTIESNPRLSYHAAASVFIGDSRQFAFSVGLAAMQVDNLDKNLQTVSDQNIQYSATNKPTISYYKVLRTGAFISLTYTPFSSIQLK